MQIRPRKRMGFLLIAIAPLFLWNADIAVFDDTDEGFDLTDHAGNRVEGKRGYRCVLTVCDGQVVYKH